jgi:hypothetical protein
MKSLNPIKALLALVLCAVSGISNQAIAQNIAPNNDLNNTSIAFPTQIQGQSPTQAEELATIPNLAANTSVIKAFEEICLKTAPSFSNAMVVSADYGILDFIQFGEVTIGATQDNSISLELVANKECVVSTKKLKDDNLVAQFQQKVAQFTDDANDADEVSQALHAPFKAKLNGQNFVFKHNREEGETFLISNLGS